MKNILRLLFNHTVVKQLIPILILLLFCFHSVKIDAQSVSVGKGSYSTSLPSGAIGPKTFTGANAVPKISAAFNKPVQTNDYWSSLIYPFYGDAFSNNLFAHPLDFKAKNNGLQIGYTLTPVYAAADYLFPFSQQLTIGVSGLNATKTFTDDYGDWTVTALWDDGTRKMKATLGHGLPFVFLTVSGGNATITSSATPTIWYNQKGVVGITVDGRHYGIFAPDSSTWTGTTTLQSSLKGKDYFSVALLPDNKLTTLETYRQHAYAFVTGSTVSWAYDETTAKLTSTFSYTTELKESGNGNLNQTLTALYRHQWLNTAAPLTSFEYNSVAGKMKVFDGNQFSTELTFEGVLPSLPDQGDYNKTDLLAMVNAVTSETLPSGPTYENGKAIARFAHVVNIADQLGAITARDHLLSEIKKRLEDWFTVGGTQEYSYNSTWDVLTGYPSGYGADNQINDHNFHSGYAIMGAAIVAQYDSVWAKPENWGGMVDLLIRDGNNWERNDTRFPFLRSFDPYAGHSWEAGHGDFGDGNNEESSSESMNFATAITLWGAVTHQNEIRDLGIYLYTTERTAIEQYWFDVDDAVFPAAYQYKALGMVWGSKGVHSTWFGANPEYIHGINMLPFTGGSLYLGRRPEYVKANYDEIVKELNGPPTIWQDIIWQYLALSDPGMALSLYYANPAYTPFDGETKAHTYHWLCNLKKMGKPDFSVIADLPTYSVFKNAAGEKTYTAYNPASDSVSVHFSDGYSLAVPPGSMRSVNSSTANTNAPVALLIADKTRGKMPLKISFTGSKSFDRNGSPLTYLWNFGDGNSASTADTVHVFTEPGIYKVIVTVTNQLLLSTKDSVLITVLGNGTPYSGTAVLVPALIQAENFDNGGEGVAYHDNDTKNVGLAYRPLEGVDLEPSNDQGFDVYWMTAGEWIEYTIQIPSDGNYDVIPFVASVPGFGNLRLLINNVDISGKKVVLNTGGWQSWKPITISNIPLKAGKQILRIEIDSDTDKANWLFSLNSIQVKLSGSVGVSEENSSPISFSLEQNYPNPFNPETSIQYSVLGSQQVSLKVYDLLGNEVATLVNEIQHAGTYQVTFNPQQPTNTQQLTSGISAEGRCASGIYFYQLRAGSFLQTKKMIFLK
ncbi:MAG: glycosyl hydrolase [Ignavibacteriaceae bacterium]|nr:glycosyl hydrolase [Ignavibacteriaceae bacterium]